MTASCLYVGTIRHRRFMPVGHELRYSIFMVYIDLAELATAFRGRWLWSVGRRNLASWRREDFLGDPRKPLDEEVRRVVFERTGATVAGPIRMLTHLRYWGLSFNPVTFYYCFDAKGAHVESVVAEITNTPWHERHVYVVGARTPGEPGQGPLGATFDKEFHVSPMMPMEQTYRWDFKAPSPDTGSALTVHMSNHDLAGGKVFDASLTLRRRELTGRSMAAALARFPCITAGILWKIYWNALRLRLKGVPFHAHPGQIRPPGPRPDSMKEHRA